MKLDPKVQRDGWIWLFCAGIFGVGLGLFLYNADNMLTYSDKEARLGNTLREIRTAQATVSAGVSDVRQLSPSSSSTDSLALVTVYDAKSVKRRKNCLLYTSPSPRDATLSRMPSSA